MNGIYLDIEWIKSFSSIPLIIIDYPLILSYLILSHLISRPEGANPYPLPTLTPTTRRRAYEALVKFLKKCRAGAQGDDMRIIDHVWNVTGVYMKRMVML